MSELVKFTCPDDKWGRPKFIKVIPKKGDIWGVLAPLKDSQWGVLINVVPGHMVAHAVRGHATPLMQILGPDPTACLRLISGKDKNRCVFINACVTANKDCYPSKKLPDCYEAPNENEDSSEFRLAASKVAIAWKDGYAILVVEGDELVI